MRLKRYIADHGDCDPLTEHLILEGHNDCTVKKGLEPFVSSWEETIKWINEDVPLVQEEYDYDISQRTNLFIVLQHASSEQKSAYSERIQTADDVFIQNTIEIDKPLAKYLPGIGMVDKDKHWWLFRIPKMGFY